MTFNTIDDTTKKIQHLVANGDSAFGDDIVNAGFELEHTPTREMIKHHEGWVRKVRPDVDGFLIGGYSSKIPEGHYLNEGDIMSTETADSLFADNWASDVRDSKIVFKNFSNFDVNRQAALLSIIHIQGYENFTDTEKKKGFPALINEANKPNPDWDRVADEFKYTIPLVSKADSTISKLYTDIGDRGVDIYNLLKGTTTVDDIIKKQELYK